MTLSQTAVSAEQQLDLVSKVFEKLGRSKSVKRTVWARHAQEFEAKIKSGDLLLIADVMWRLYPPLGQIVVFNSERQLYEAALKILAHEIAFINGSSELHVRELIEKQLLDSWLRFKQK